MKKVYLLFWIISVFALVSCEKNELKLPARVFLEFDMSTLSLTENTKTSQNFTIDEAYMVINSIEFNGEREQGGNYYFNRNFQNALQAEMHSGATNNNVSFDIPQGVYNLIEISLYTGDSLHPSIQLRGRFERGPFENIPVLFEYSFKEEMRVRARNKEGNRDVVLTKDSPSTATILFDAPFMFQLLNMGMIRNAQTTDSEGTETLIINNQQNTEIFNILATRLEKSLQVIFE